MASNFFAARIKEIESLSSEIGKHPERGLQFQNLPFKCRRRAASHHRNRIPSRIRDCHQDIEPGGKRPSKKFKKRRSLKERLSHPKRTKHWMQTHKWHAKRFHMARIENDWIVPLTSNHKNFRAVYRATVKHLYMEDNSYWQCIEISSSKDAIVSCFGKVIADSVFHSSLEACLVPGREVDAWLYDKTDLLLGNAKCQWLTGDRLRMWCHPGSLEKIMHLLQGNNQLEKKMAVLPMSRFRFFGCNIFQGNFQNYVKKDLPDSTGNVFKFRLNDFDPKVFDNVDDECDIVHVSERCSDLLIPSKHAFQMWLKFVHEKTQIQIGCLDSQEQIDIEYRRLSSARLQADVLLESSPEKWSQVQHKLVSIATTWREEPVLKFKIIRESRAILQYQKAVEGKPELKETEFKDIPAFLPISVEMSFGGKLHDGSKIYFPCDLESGKFVKESLQVPFKDDPVVGIVTACTFSQRIACCSGLGLLSVDALESVLRLRSLPNLSVVAISNPLNGLLYRAKLKLITE